MFLKINGPVIITFIYLLDLFGSTLYFYNKNMILTTPFLNLKTSTCLVLFFILTVSK